MPKLNAIKSKLPSGSTTAGVLSTLVVGSVGTYLTLHYASEVGKDCYKAVHGRLNEAIDELVDYKIQIPSNTFILNSTMSGAEMETEFGMQTLPTFTLTIPVDTPSFVTRVADLLGEHIVQSFYNASDDIASAVSDNVCYNQVLAHGLVITLMLTGLLALLTYSCRLNTKLNDSVAELKSQTEAMQKQLLLLSKSLVAGPTIESDVDPIVSNSAFRV